MTRDQIIKQRDEVFAELLNIGKWIVDGNCVDPGQPQQFTFLVMLHNVLCAQLKALDETAAHANAVVQLDEVLGLLTDVYMGGKLLGEVIDELRAKIHSALAYLES